MKATVYGQIEGPKLYRASLDSAGKQVLNSSTNEFNAPLGSLLCQFFLLTNDHLGLPMYSQFSGVFYSEMEKVQNEQLPIGNFTQKVNNFASK